MLGFVTPIITSSVCPLTAWLARTDGSQCASFSSVAETVNRVPKNVRDGPARQTYSVRIYKENKESVFPDVWTLTR